MIASSTSLSRQTMFSEAFVFLVPGYFGFGLRLLDFDSAGLHVGDLLFEAFGSGICSISCVVIGPSV
jgi:hypothetical protein